MKSTCYIGLVPIAAFLVLSSPVPFDAGIEQIQFGSPLQVVQVPSPLGSYLSQQAVPNSITMTMENPIRHQGKIVIVQEKIVPTKLEDDSTDKALESGDDSIKLNKRGNCGGSSENALESGDDSIKLNKRGNCTGGGNVVEDGPGPSTSRNKGKKQMEEAPHINSAGNPIGYTNERLKSMSDKEKTHLIKPGPVRADVVIHKENM